MMDFGTQIDL